MSVRTFAPGRRPPAYSAPCHLLTPILKSERLSALSLIPDVAPTPDPVVFPSRPAHCFYGTGSFIYSFFPPPSCTISFHASSLKCSCLSSIPLYRPSPPSVRPRVNSFTNNSFPGRCCISLVRSCSGPSIHFHSLGVITLSLVYASRALWSTWNITLNFLWVQ